MMENYLLRAKHENYALGSFNVNTYDEMVALCETAGAARAAADPHGEHELRPLHG